MENINRSEIEYFRKILKISEKDGISKININFDRFSVRVHPSIRREQKYIDYFEQLVIAREFLIYLKKNQKSLDTDQIVFNWNNLEKEKVEAIIENYKSMSLKEYKKAVEPKFLILTIMKSCAFVFLGIISLLAVLVITAYIFSGSLTAMGIVTFLAIIVVLIGYSFAGTRRGNFWGRR